MAKVYHVLRPFAQSLSGHIPKDPTEPKGHQKDCKEMRNSCNSSQIRKARELQELQ